VLPRRQFLRDGGLAAAALLAGGRLAGEAPASAQTSLAAKEQVEVLPVEDLMREHGVLRRTLLVFDRARLLLTGQQPLPPDVIKKAAGIIDTFIQQYHEQLEEKHVFPMTRKLPALAELTNTLQQQHDAGRKLIDWVGKNSSADDLKKAEVRQKLVDYLAAFERMYRPHAAQEDTVLFPAFHEMLSPREYEKLGDEFEGQETKALGEGGFEKYVARVAQLEKELGIADLAQFTPKLS